MKKLLIAVALILSTAALRAQTEEQTLELARKQGAAGYEDLPVVADLRLFEFEVGVGMNLGRKWDGLKTKVGTNFFAELRLNRPEPWDVALQLKMAGFSHSAGAVANIKTTMINPSVFVDYNLRFDRFTSLFAGVGFGGNFAQNKAVVAIGPHTGFVFDHNAKSFSVTPRAGISVFNFLRITAEYTFATRDYSRFGLGVGLTLGGSYRNTYIDRRSRKEKFWEDTAPAIINSLVP